MPGEAMKKSPDIPIDAILGAQAPLLIGGAPDGLDALALGHIANALCQAKRDRPASLLHVARDDKQMAAIEAALRFFAPNIKPVAFPAWDCVPYDRVSPKADIASRRIAALARLAVATRQKADQPVVILTTINALLQRVPPRAFMAACVTRLKSGVELPLDDLVARLETSGFSRSGNVMDPGDYAVRGGIVDLFPPARQRPVRLDFFGDTLESIRVFDPDTQRTSRTLKEFALLPVSEVPFGDAVTRAFRQRYVELFGTVTSSDPLYEAISSGHRFPGMEHWLPLFHDRLETLFDYLPEVSVSFDHLTEDARTRRQEQIADHYASRAESLEQKSFGAPPYKPVPVKQMFVDNSDWQLYLAGRRIFSFSPFEMPEQSKAVAAVSLGGRQGPTFAAERADEGVNVFDRVIAHIRALQEKGKRAIICCWSNGARERLQDLLGDHGLEAMQSIENFHEAEALPPGITGLALLGLESGFETRVDLR